MTILDDIVKHKRDEVTAASKAMPLERLKREVGSTLVDVRGFKFALEQDAHRPAIIAEIKQKSPSKGILREDFNVREIAKGYAANGAAAISVLTDERYFGGRLSHLRDVKEVTSCPVLRKDFIVDEYQVYESLLAGADAILLIAGALTREELKRLYETAVAIGLDVLIEVHSEDELAGIQPFSQAVIGVNNRDLKTFDVDLKTTEKLMARIPQGRTVISESGIRTREDLRILSEHGVRGVLIGESLMTQPSPGEALKELIG